MVHRREIVGLLLALLLPILAACGGNTGNTTTGSAAASAGTTGGTTGGAATATTDAGTTGGTATTATAGAGTTGGTATTATAGAGTTGGAATTATANTAGAGTAATTTGGTDATTTAGGAGTDETATAAGGADYSAWVGQQPSVDNAPEVFNADQAKQYSGVQITYYGEASGIGLELSTALEQKFTEATGIQIRHVPNPQSATEYYSTLQRFFQGQSADVDAMMIDVIWPGAFAQHLADLGPALGQDAQQHYPGIVENNTVDGKLVGIPFFGDFGMLYYRTDLLQKYGFNAPPQTWDELEQQARTIMDGEKANDPQFSGFVFQGNAYEGLTCDALEWIASTTGHGFIENGQPMMNDPQVIEILNRVKGWVGTIAPRGVTTYQEEEARNAFQGGHAAFMRNWPYAYALGNAEDSPVRGKFDVAPLPSANGQEPVGTVGGWQLAVSTYSKNQDAAIEFIRYMASPEVQAYRAIIGSFVPTIPMVAESAAVVETNPYLESVGNVQRVTRPSRELGDRYNEGSTVVFQGVNQILNGQDAAAVVAQMDQRLQRLAR